ncbi:hypothetical protein [Rheinheimera metallidurans]|uniref:hypothetical protein n=1 Tax=Rheinheimera metallidurans TaxID=2925781 RepID=UPI0030023BA4
MSISIIEQQLIPDVAAAQQGDMRAFERLIGRCQRSVCSIALAIVKDVDAVATSQAGGVTKIFLLLGGAMFGALAGVVAIVGGMHLPIKHANSPELKQQLIALRNGSVIWVLLFGLLLTAAYELTQGAWAPITVFSLFCLGLAGVIVLRRVLLRKLANKRQ